ncbi:MAG: deoxyribose-phosphate aldolase [Candidatus Caldarchaeum sp.]|uniref:Deoxyribose-phosphate aldolase n=1 Tax=Caldiarchaeum subterraneum TaxID=311458 RepID=A0A7C5U657_CALS0
MEKYSPEYIASRIQHTNVSPDATRKDIEKLCRECVQYGFSSAVVNPIWVKTAVNLLRGTSVKVSAALNFPIGASSTIAKAVEIRNCVAAGCDEFDIMLNIGYLKSGMIDEFRKDVETMVESADSRIVKAILETSILTPEELKVAAQICEECGVHYIKNSSGWGKGGPATPEVIRLLRSLVSSKVGVKASGGIRDRETAVKLLEAGADLLGTSRGVQIILGTGVGEEVQY